MRNQHYQFEAANCVSKIDRGLYSAKIRLYFLYFAQKYGPVVVFRANRHKQLKELETSIN